MAALGQPLCRDALGNSFGKQLRGTALGSSPGQLSGTTLPNNCFEEGQLWGAAFRGSFTDNFGEQLSVATLGRSFREPLCRMALGSRGTIILTNRRIAALRNNFRGRLYKQLRRAAFSSNFREQLSEAALHRNSFGQ